LFAIDYLADYHFNRAVARKNSSSSFLLWCYSSCDVTLSSVENSLKNKFHIVTAYQTPQKIVILMW